MTNPFPLSQAQVQLTLAALAYAADTKDSKTGEYPPMSVVKARITGQLNSNEYCANHTWTVVWGPVQTSLTDNLVYVALNTVSGELAVNLRGTTTQFLSRLEDLPSGQITFPTGNTTGAAVSAEFHNALSEMLDAKDPDTGLTLQAYVAGQITQGQTVYVNGHSQGAALVPMMQAALQNGWNSIPGIAATFKGFAFAPPTSGNPAFATWVADTVDCWFVINPLDIVPLGYDAIMDIITKTIPGPIPDGWEGYAIKKLVNYAAYIASLAGTWAQPSQQALTQSVPLPDLHFFEQIGGQHNHNSYLHLLGAKQITNDASGASPMSGTITPPYVTVP
ncbi:hypothetical protein ASD8599_02599 [Ascidiaceihabitans donghaensis]|uniref:Fungal lipase-type domain-containing protein n=1 Tax=Ascidiaceihabitans donghaensis TaxID=1510460 RepID=A0A2R8BFI2_9RHOB|nr:hypothetical protein [Ascidiaceihabitans donghaensis]SPH21848.1 hypothetical protein ASD8599_02599 [Ascidiaceihabitans donghaensis]